jgi:predicted PurR-regulated permease PerM
LALIDSRTIRVLITASLFAVAVAFLYATRETLIAFLFAIFFANLMGPLVSYLEKSLNSRNLAISVI